MALPSPSSRLSEAECRHQHHAISRFLFETNYGLARRQRSVRHDAVTQHLTTRRHAQSEPKIPARLAAEIGIRMTHTNHPSHRISSNGSRRGACRISPSYFDCNEWAVSKLSAIQRVCPVLLTGPL